MKNTVQDSFNHLMGLAQRSHQKGDLPMAVNLYKEALKVLPKQMDALHFLGIAYCSQQNYTEGIKYLEKASALFPDNPVVLTNLSNAYSKIEAYSSALPLLQKSVQLKPDFDEAWHKLGNAYKGVSNLEKAIPAYEKAIALNPQHFNAYYNLGNTMMSMGNYKTSISLYEKCLTINPNFALGHNNLAIALLEWDRLQEAEHHYLKAIQLNPTFKEAIKNICQLYEKAGKEEQAKHWNQELLKLLPSDKALRFHIATKSTAIYKNNGEIDRYRYILDQTLKDAFHDKPLTIDSYMEFDCYPSSELIYQGRIDREVKENYAQFYSEIPRLRVKHNNSRCHVGFIVTHGHEGVFLKCMKGILNNIDTSKMDVSIVCSDPNGYKIISPAVTNTAIKFIKIPKDFIKAQEVILNARIDILHYWEIGTDSTNYFLALTKPAKIQVTSWGWPTTSGLSSVDYFISQKELETEETKYHYTEQLVLFDKMPTFYYRPPVPEVKRTLKEYGLPEDKRLYFCQQNLRKVHPDFDTIVSELLKKDPEAIIVFINDKQETFTKKLLNRISLSIGNSSRVVFVERMSEEEYLGLLAQCTVVLDTLHYGGGANTIYDAIEAGVPVVTLDGIKHSARFASATLKQLGVTETITFSIGEYVDKAICIASNLSLRNRIVEKMNKNAFTIFEDMDAVKELEVFFLEKFNEI